MADGNQERPQLSRRDLARGKGRRKENTGGEIRRGTILPPSSESIARQSLIHDEPAIESSRRNEPSSRDLNAVDHGDGSKPNRNDPTPFTADEMRGLPRPEHISPERVRDQSNLELAARVQQLVLEGKLEEAQALLAGGQERRGQEPPSPNAQQNPGETVVDAGDELISVPPENSSEVAYENRSGVIRRVVQAEVNDIGDESEVNEVLRKGIRETKGDGTINIYGIQGNEGVIEAIASKLARDGFRVSIAEAEDGVAYEIKALPIERRVEISDQDLRDAQGMILAQTDDEMIITAHLLDAGRYEGSVKALASLLRLVKDGRAQGKTRVESVADKWRHPSRDEAEYLEEFRRDPDFAKRIKKEVEDEIYRQMETIVSPRQVMLVLESLNLGEEMEGGIKSRLRKTWESDVEDYESNPPTSPHEQAEFRLEQEGLRILDEEEAVRGRAQNETAPSPAQEEEDVTPEGQLLRGLGYRGRPMSASQVFESLPDRGKDWIIGQKPPGSDPESPAEVAKVFIPMIESGQLPVDAKVLGALDGPLRIAVVNGLTGGRREEAQKILETLEGRHAQAAGHGEPHGDAHGGGHKEEKKEREWKESDSWWVTRGLKKGVQSISGALKKEQPDQKAEPVLTSEEQIRVDATSLNEVSRSVGRKLAATPEEAGEIIDRAVRLAANGQLAQENGHYSPEMANINELFKQIFANPNIPTHLRERLDEAFSARLRDVAATGDKRSIRQLLRVADFLRFDRELPRTNALFFEAQKILM